jgi:hypothetical protein
MRANPDHGAALQLWIEKSPLEWVSSVKTLADRTCATIPVLVLVSSTASTLILQRNMMKTQNGGATSTIQLEHVVADDFFHFEP